MGFFSKGIKQGMASGALGGIIEQVPTAEGAANAANARKKKEKMDQQESIASINLDRLNQARLDSKTMVADQLASRESGWRKQQTQLNKLSLQQSLYKSKIGTVV